MFSSYQDAPTDGYCLARKAQFRICLSADIVWIFPFQLPAADKSTRGTHLVAFLADGTSRQNLCHVGCLAEATPGFRASSLPCWLLSSLREVCWWTKWKAFPLMHCWDFSGCARSFLKAFTEQGYSSVPEMSPVPRRGWNPSRSLLWVWENKFILLKGTLKNLDVFNDPEFLWQYDFSINPFPFLSSLL